MKQIQFTFLAFAVAAAIFIMLIGIFIAEGSLLGIVFAIIALVVTMALGFISKKRLNK